MESKKNTCAILVTSCDKYEDAWPPFFTLFSIMWPNCKYPIYLNTETKEYKHPKVNIICVHPESNFEKKHRPISWSQRLKQAVQQIDSDYILFFLEDFFLKSPVRSDIVDECINRMNEDPDIAIIDFFHEPYEKVEMDGEFAPIKRNYDYCINTMAAIWRKDFLLSILRDENPWDFEFFGTERWRKTGKKILTHRNEFAPVFDYEIDTALGYGIYQGKWLRGNIDLFKKYGIEVDFSYRGFVDPPSMKAREREKNWFLHDIVKMLKEPRLFMHYIDCTKNVLKDKSRRFRARYFNR